jgi:hypothetical protein
MGVMKSGTGRSGRDIEGLGDLGRRVPEVVMQNEDRPLLGRQPSEPAFEQVPIGHGYEVIRSGRSVDRQHPEMGGSATLARRLVDALMDKEPAEPSVEPVRIAEAPKVTPGDHQRVLQCVLGPIDVAKDSLSDREEMVTARTDQVDVRLLVSALCRLDEIPVHREPLVAPSGGAVHPSWPRRMAARSFFGESAANRNVILRVGVTARAAVTDRRRGK